MRNNFAKTDLFTTAMHALSARINMWLLLYVAQRIKRANFGAEFNGIFVLTHELKA